MGNWRGAWPVAIAAAIGNLLQGWDNATIAGAILYIKEEFELEDNPTLEGLIVAMSLIGATAFTTVSGPMSDWLGRKSMLIISSAFYTVSSLVMLWSPNVYVLLVGRLLDGLGVGLAVTLVPAYISEIAPSDIRGQLNTLPQFLGSGGMFLSYCMVFGMSLMDNPSWRLMLSVLFIPSLLYMLLTIFYLPESPRWLVSKGRMREAKIILQQIRGKEDVSGEMALLVEGLAVGSMTSLEEFIIQPTADVVGDGQESVVDNGNIRLYGPEEGMSWVAKPISSDLGGQSFMSRHGSLQTQSVPMMDPVVTLFGSFRSNTHDQLPEGGSMRSMLGSMWNVAEENNCFDEDRFPEDEETGHGDEGYASEDAAGDLDENLHSPLLSRPMSGRWDHSAHPPPADTFSNTASNVLYRGSSRPPAPQHGSALSMPRHGSLTSAHPGSMTGSLAGGGSMTGIGGGWQLAWQWTGPEGKESNAEEGSFRRIYLRQEGSTGGGGNAHSRRASMMSLPSVNNAPNEMMMMEPIQAAALVSQRTLYGTDLLDEKPVGPAIVHPSETAVSGPKWTDLFEGGVKRALIVGIGLQFLQQFAGINGVLYYTPQILEQSGADVLFANMGISSDSASLLISAFTSLLMLPSIAVAMRLMDEAGRRKLLLTTIPVLILSVLILVLANVISMGDVLEAAMSCIGVILYICCFVMGFGPIPNIICAEIFPTRVRGVCIAICALTFWIGDIIVTYSLPVLLVAIGITGLFSIYASVCLIAWVFVFLKVPETKGMPLEVITEFFAMSAAAAKQTAKLQD